MVWMRVLSSAGCHRSRSSGRSHTSPSCDAVNPDPCIWPKSYGVDFRIFKNYGRCLAANDVAVQLSRPTPGQMAPTSVQIGHLATILLHMTVGSYS